MSNHERELQFLLEVQLRDPEAVLDGRDAENIRTMLSNESRLVAMIRALVAEIRLMDPDKHGTRAIVLEAECLIGEVES